MTADPPSAGRGATERQVAEKELLSRELKELCEQTPQRPASQASRRDKMIFQLYFSDGLSAKQPSAGLWDDTAKLPKVIFCNEDGGYLDSSNLVDRNFLRCLRVPG